MDPGRCIQPDPPCGVSFKTIGLVLGSAVVGGALTVLFLRAVAGEMESVSVVGLIGFLFMLILATVAITLSVVSISLSRKVERTLMRSGGVAESPELMSRLESFAPVPAKPERISLCVSAVDKAGKKYCDFKDIVLLGVSNFPGVSSRKVGKGHYRTAGDELVDGSFLINQEQVAVCVFSISDLLAERFLGKQGEKLSGFLRAFFNELKKGAFNRVFLVFDGVLNNASPYAKALNEFSSRVDASDFSRFELFEGSPEIVIPELTERVSQLMAQESGEASG